jgi:DNA-damage-inducible protein J
MKMTATKTTLNIKIDKNIKERAAQLLKSMGLDHTTAIDMYYRQIITERRLPFQPSVAQTYGNQLLELIKTKNIPIKSVEVNANGHIIVDKEKDPELYDWAVNG